MSILRTLFFLASIYIFYLLLNEGPDWLWYLLVLGGVLFLAAVSHFIDQKAKLDYLKNLRHELQSEWDYLHQSRLSRVVLDHSSTENHPFARDLNLFGANSLHHHIDRSLSQAGALRLAEILEANEGMAIAEKQDFVRDLEADRERNFHLRALGHQLVDDKALPSKLRAWAGKTFKAIPNLFMPFLLMGSLFAFYRLYVLVLDFNAIHFQILLYAMSFNLMLLFLRMKVFREQQAVLGQLSEAMKTYASIFKSIEAAQYPSEMGRAFLAKINNGTKVSVELGRLSKFLESLDNMSNAIVLVLVNGFIPYHLAKLRSLEKWHQQYASKLPEWIEALANWEAYMSLANYCDVHSDYVWPTISEKPLFECSELGHPLIPKDQCVSNSYDFKLAPYLILTGSNMSGKSTFLRTIGLNLILAQIGAKVCAESMHTYPFQVLASMSPTDNLHDNKSYFQSEVLRLKMLIDKISDKRWSLLILDEILRGTNSDDKKLGSRKFLLGLRTKAAFGMLATHDVDIAELAEEHPEFSASYFESQVEGQKLLFDYKLRKGVCRTPNANLLMQNYGLFNLEG